MAFEELKENSENIQEQVGKFVDANIEYYKLHSFKIVMKSTTAILKFSLILFAVIMVLFFSSIALALVLGSYFCSFPLGFLAVGGIYVLIAIVLYLIRDKMVERPILEKFSGIFFNE